MSPVGQANPSKGEKLFPYLLLFRLGDCVASVRKASYGMRESFLQKTEGALCI